MKLHLINAASFLSGCAPHAPTLEPGLSEDLVRHDEGTITGSWRETLRNGRRVNKGYALSIGYPHPFTFAAQKGCTVTGGVLEELRGGFYRIQRYESGFSTPGCGPWRSGPELAPFDGSEVMLSREGDRLFARGEEHSIEFVRLRLESGS